VRTLALRKRAVASDWKLCSITDAMHQSGIIERIAQWAGCAVSLVLWAALDADLQNALWWAAKLDGHPIGGTVRLEKVVLCLGWSLLVLFLFCYRYRAPIVGILGLLAGTTLIVRALFGFSTIYAFEIPGFYLIATTSLAVAYWLAPIMISAVMAYLLVARRAFARTTEGIAAAAILALYATMVWIGLFDIIHPGIGWR
jgi:hypothetical protein